MPKVFISYSHDSREHADLVLELSNRLRSEGVDCYIDQYEVSPPEGWPTWMLRQVREADFVLVICTETYRRRFEGLEEVGTGLGAKWEGAIITQELYEVEGKNTRFIPVCLAKQDLPHIPVLLRGATHYALDTSDGYDELYFRLTDQRGVVKPDLGEPRKRPLPVPERKQDFFGHYWNVPIPPNPLFTGRKYVLSQIEEGLKGAGAVALSGMSGSGKSQTASHYAHLHRDEYQTVLWIPGDSRAALLLGLAHVALLLDLPQKDAREPEVAASAVRRWLEAESNWLLVIDNVEDLSLLPEFLPQKVTGHLLLTTQQQALATLAQRVDMHAMEPEEGGLLLPRRAKVIEPQARLDAAKPTDRQAAIEISSELGGLPLALDQAGAYIEETDCGLTEYLKLYHTHGEKLRGRRGGAAPGHPESVAVSFELCFEKLKQVNIAAAELVQFCAFLHPDAIPEELIELGAAEMGPHSEGLARDKLNFNEAVGAALKYSLLRRDAEVRTLSIHRLVQAVLRDGLDKQTERKLAERVVRAADQAFPLVQFANWPQCDRLLPHAQACAVLIQEFDLETHEAAGLLNDAGFYLSERARYGEAEPLYQRALGIREKALGLEHPDVAIGLNNLAVLYHSQARYGEAEPLYRRALGIWEKALGPEHPSVATLLENHADLLRKMNRAPEADRLESRARAIREKLGGAPPTSGA
ncbi:MAG: tetratricopeptide repeat protein [Candidatus Acidiferrales bacterium]